MIDLSAPLPLIYLWVWAVSGVVVGSLAAGIEQRAEPWWETAALCVIGGMVCAVVAIVVGAWDGLVWLVKADWRTTDFVVPIIAGPAAVVFGILGRGFMELSDSAARWANRLVPGSAPQ